MKFKLISLLLLLVYTCSTCFSQESRRYKLNVKKDAIVIGSGTALSLLAIYRESRISDISNSELQLLNSNDVNGFDRFAIENSSTNAAQYSDLGLYLALGSSALLLAPKQSRNEFKSILIMGIEAVSLNYAATYLTKSTFLRFRPYTYQKNGPYDRFDKDGRFSFISGHASFSAVSMAFTCSALYPYLDKTWQRTALIGFSIAIPATVAYLRVASGKHFPTDVLAGLLTGAIIGYSIPKLHLVKNPRLSISSLGNGVQLRYAIL